MRVLINRNNRIEALYWPIAIGLGLLISIALFLAIPRLDEIPSLSPVKVIELDFFEWQPPPKPAPAQPKAHVKPKPKPILKPTETKPKEITPPKPDPVLTEQEIENEPQPIPEPEPPSQQVESPLPAQEVLPSPVPLATLTAMPRFLHKERPIYPRAMHTAGKEAIVKLNVLIDKHGNIRDITIKKSAGPDFDQAAIAAIRQSSFSPGEIEHQAVAVLLTVPVKFKLR